MPAVIYTGSRLRLLFLCTAVAVTLCTPLNDSFAANKESILESRILKIGEKAPIFQCKELGGEDFDLARHIGEKPVVLFFWSFFCGPCREEMPILQKVYEEIGIDKVHIVGINLDGEKLGNAIEKFMSDSNLDFTTVFDELNGLEYKIADPYGVAGTPTVYAIGLEGQIIFSTVGRIEPQELKDAIRQSTGQGS